MIQTETQIRVRYAEADRMGYAYHGHYAEYFEIARCDWCRQLGMPYKEIEERGIIMPVVELNMKYLRPAFYDDVLTVKIILKEKPDRRIVMEGEFYNQQQKLTTLASASIAFVEKETMKPVRVPEFISEAIEKNWERQKT